MQDPTVSDRRDSMAPLRIEVGIRTLALIPIVAAAVFILLRLLPVLLVLFVALFIVGTLNPAVVWLEQRGVRRGVAIGIVFGAAMALTAGALAVTLPTLFEQFATLVREEPTLRGKLVGWLARYRATLQLSESIRNLNYGTLLKAAAATVFEYSTRSIEIVTYFAASVFLALYMMLDRDRLRGGLFALVPRRRHLMLSRIVLNLEVIVGGYIRGQLLTSLLMTAFTCILLTLCSVKGALAIGVIAGIADVLPYIGVLLSVGPAVAGAAMRGPAVAVLVLVAMLIYEEVESRFLVPRIYGRVLKLPSSVVLFALLAGGTLLGLLGAMLALPVAAALRMLIEEMRMELPGEVSQDPAARAEDAIAEAEYAERSQDVPAEGAAAIALEISEAQTKRETSDQD